MTALSIISLQQTTNYISHIPKVPLYSWMHSNGLEMERRGKCRQPLPTTISVTEFYTIHGNYFTI